MRGCEGEKTRKSKSDRRPKKGGIGEFNAEIVKEREKKRSNIGDQIDVVGEVGSINIRKSGKTRDNKTRRERGAIPSHKIISELSRKTRRG